MPALKKIHSCKPHNATLKPKLAREYFFLPPKKNFFLPFLFLIKLFFPTHGFTTNSNSCASNVNRFEQSACGLQTVVLRSDSSGMRITLRLKEIKKRRALRGKQTVVHLIDSVGKRTVVVLNPSFFYFSLHRLAQTCTACLPSLFRQTVQKPLIIFS